MLREGRQVLDLERVSLQVEELGTVNVRVADELPAAVIKRLLDALVTEHQERAGGLRRILEDSRELTALGILRRRDAAELTQRGHDVEEVAHRITALVGGDARASDDQRHAHGVLVEVLLTDETVRTASHTRVGGVDDDGIGGEGRRIHGIEHAADLDVQKAHVTIILGQHRLHIDLGARPLHQLLVADDHLAVVERMLGQEVRRQGNRSDVILDWETVGHDVRVMRTIKSQIGEERLLAVLRLQERQGLVGRLFAQMLRRDLCWGQLTCRQHIAGRGLQRISHAADEERLGLLEGLGDRRRTVMPLARGEGGVAGRTEGVGPGLMLQ